MLFRKLSKKEIADAVEEIKNELINEGKIFESKNYLGYKRYSLHGKKIKPEFPGLLSKMIKADKKTEPTIIKKHNEQKTQFRGTSQNNKKRPELIIGKNGYKFLYYGDK